MRINYNDWFYNQHKYRTSKRDGIESFTDTKWYNINERFKKLVDMESSLLTEQPSLVQGNKKGFDMLIDLLARSNYTFEDLDSSLKEAYRVSLQNTMSRNVVNTHAVIFHTSINDKKNVSSAKFSNYKIIDAPFNQLHFGNRDEFIRQQIHEMHITENDHYVDISEFNKSKISDILDFCIICSINGFISNDCKIAIDDHGFKFKIGDRNSNNNTEFIVYKLDRCKMLTVSNLSVSVFDSLIIPYDSLSGINQKNVVGKKCLINIYNTNYKDTITTAPNFGVFTNDGLMIKSIQESTRSMISNLNMKNISMDIYAIKYIHEVPNVFPAVNYYDIMDSKLVYDERYEKLRTVDGGLVVETSADPSNDLELCTPPITIDRDTSYSFDTIVKCLHLYDDMNVFVPLMNKIGNFMLYPTSIIDFDDNIRPELSVMVSKMTVCYNTYLKGAVITSLVSNDKINSFDKLMGNLKNLLNNFKDITESEKFTFDELYGDNYITTVRNICQPFMNEKLSQFKRASDIQNNFFEKEPATRFNRPIAEQSFISLKYSDEYKSWLFTYPEIKHFHGIGNTFYVDTNLKGNEIFKFFVLYTDAEDPANPYIEHFDLDTVIDFDSFYNEMTKYNGCIRYWDAESRIAKISKILYRKYDDETSIHVLSKILKRKIDCPSIIDMYPSDINYEPSNVTSDNIENYDEESERGPFSINFLFYTLSMLNNNVDKLQAYFYRDLTENKYSNRYADIDLSAVIHDVEYPISFAQYTISPSRFPSDHLPTDNSYLAFYGLPLFMNSTGTTNLYDPYRCVLNVYDENTNYPFIDIDGVNPEYYVNYTDITEYNGEVVSYKDTIEFCRLLTTYLDCIYDYTSELQTNYKKSFNVSSICDRGIETTANINNALTGLIDNGHIENITTGLITTDDIISLINSDAFSRELTTIKTYAETIFTGKFESVSPTINNDIVTFININVIQPLKKVYTMYGVDDDVKDRVKTLYDHLIKINTPMNPYVFKNWLNDIDIHILSSLDSHVAYNENYNYSNTLFQDMSTTLSTYIENAVPMLEDLIAEIDNLTDEFYTTNVTPIVSYCDTILNDVIFDVYTYDTLKIPSLTSNQYSSIPNMLVLAMPNDSHIVPPYGPAIPGDHHLFFKLKYEEISNDTYKITSFANICEYVFFDGTPLTNLTAYVISPTGTVLDTFTGCEMSFIRAGSNADKGEAFNQLSNLDTTVVDIENHHEAFDVVSDIVVNEKTAPMNYELLVGNNFMQLDHESEMILNPNTWNPGSIDRIFIENQVINRMSMADHGHEECSTVYFKPCQVEHPSESVNGKYFEGETVYVKTPDNAYIFPVKITAVDHSINKGFVEAEVDQWNSTWFKITDKTQISEYLNDVVECEVIDDNVRNFLDEYSDTTLKSYYQPPFDSDVMDDKHVTCYTLPGDPLTVTTSAPYIYSRLVWMFNEDIDNRFIDEESKKYRFIYIGEGFIPNDDDVMKINMINHDFNNMTLPEKYPILKDEPNEHRIWNKEIEKFLAVKQDAEVKCRKLADKYDEAKAIMDEYVEEHRYYECKKQMNVLSGIEDEINYNKNLIDRMDRLIYQLEPKTTWFNVISMNAALVYIDNGRAGKYSPSFISNIRDLLYTDAVKVYLYDWEHKLWIDPSTYEISYEIVDDVKIDEYADYTTNRVLTSITITPLNSSFSYSNKILVYFAYDKSDIFDDVVMNSNKCNVRFKPLLVLDKEAKDYDPYYGMKIRKHFDGYEKYETRYGDDGLIHVKRIRRSGKYNYSPVFRLCDISIHDNNGDHDYTSIASIKVKSPFSGLTTDRKLNKPLYQVTINAPIDSFTENEHIKLICISNNEMSSYDGNISSIMFEGVTSMSGDDQVITISNSTLPNYVTGNFVCTVFNDDAYQSCGGVVSIKITTQKLDIYDDWITIPADMAYYRELPDEFKLSVMNAIMNSNATVTLSNSYIKNHDDTISETNTLQNPYEYYYHTTKHKRLPISDVRRNAHDRRLVIDTTTNPDVNLVKSTYIGICRYSLSKIPKNGVIDMTGYLPTPLSRNRYEFWVNGRYVSGTKDLIILSPTSIQLCNMKSLRNFECIELVDDMDSDNDLMHKGNVYVDINGNTFSSFKLAMLSNTKIRKQNVSYVFNANNHDAMSDYYVSIIENPNNVDIEDDILSTVTFDDSTMDYNELFNIPTINGISLYHPNISSLGITEIPDDDIIKEFDKIWKKEETTNPLFIMTHRDTVNNNDNKLTLHVIEITEPHWHDLDIDTTGMFKIHTTGPVEKYFTLYVSRTIDGEIDDVDNTVKIIPFMSSNVYVLLDSSYRGMYLHSTYPNTTPIHII